MLSIQPKILRVSTSLTHFLRPASSSSKPSDIGWSHGEKQKPTNWKHIKENFYKLPDHRVKPLNYDPKDPEHQYPYKLPDGGIQHFNFVYYPRDPETFKEPPIKPTKLLFVYRYKRMKHRPYWEQNILKNLGIAKHGASPATIVKNIPEINAMLWQVKHLVVVKPLRFPENMPEDRNPLHYYIQDDGQVIYHPEVDVTEKDLEDNITETTLTPNWINTKTKFIYDNSLKLEF